MGRSIKNPRMTSLCLFFKLSVKYDNYPFRERIIHAEDSHISSFTTINHFFIDCLSGLIHKELSYKKRLFNRKVSFVFL